MATQAITIEDQIHTEMAACIGAARAQGYDGTDAEYEYTMADLDYAVAAIGRKPTSEEWSDAGMSHVGGAHRS